MFQEFIVLKRGRKLKLGILFLFICLSIVSSNTFAQLTDTELGKSSTYTRSGMYDFSDPGALNIKVSVWGYIARPGKYVVPDYTTVSDLLTYAGGPNQDAEMDDLRIYRVLENGQEEMMKFSYNDIMWENNLSSKPRVLPKLEASDILVVPGSPKLFFKDWFDITITLVSLSLSIINLIVVLNL
jgi:hypothetical protein